MRSHAGPGSKSLAFLVVEGAIAVSYNKRIEKGHHRTEIREVWSVPVAAIGELHQPQTWAGLQSIVMVVRVRHLWNKTTREVQFYLTSLTSDAQLRSSGHPQTLGD